MDLTPAQATSNRTGKSRDLVGIEPATSESAVCHWGHCINWVAERLVVYISSKFKNIFLLTVYCSISDCPTTTSDRYLFTAMDYPLCGAEEQTVAHFVTEYTVLENVRERIGMAREDALEWILLFREKTKEKVERSIALLKDKKINRSTNAGPAHQ